MLRLVSAALLLALGLPLAATPATAQRAPLTVEQITQRPETWVGAWPAAPFWTDAGDALYFAWNPRGAFDADSLFRADADGAGVRRLTPAERRALAPRHENRHQAPHAWRAGRRVAVQDGDVVLVEPGGATRRLTRTTEPERDPLWLADGRLAYRRGDALFALDLATGATEQLTDLRAGAAPADADPGDAERFLRDQQTRLFDVLREAARRDSLRDLARARDAATGPPTVYTGSRSVEGLTVSPDGRTVTFRLREDGATARTQMTRYVTGSGAAEAFTARPKVGAPRGAATLYVQTADTTRAVDLTTLPGASDGPRRDGAVVPDSARGLVAWGPYWSPDGSWAVVDVRSDDNRDRWIARLDPETASVTLLDRQRDDAWIAGPGIAWWGGESTVGWTAGEGRRGPRFWFQSERTGWSHLYAVDSGGTVEALTEGPFEVSEPALTPDGRRWVFQSSEGDLGQRHVWAMPAAAPGRAAEAFAQRERLTEGVGRWDYALSPDGETLALLHSAANRPPDVFVQRLGGDAVRVTESATPEWLAHGWLAPEIVQVPASDGAAVPARIYRPEDVGAEPNGAAVLFVHGAGYLQNAHRWWSDYHREYQFHHLLAERGYVVLDLDYRASAGYGRDWRTAVAGHMGGRDLQDYVDASRWLGATRGIEPERVAIYGGSYGGFLTLMALFTEPEHFGGGAAMRSVTDWAHYNDTYTRNILGTPTEAPEAYRRSSPIEFAAGLEDPLLMTHGLVDDNVQPQDIFRLSQRLIELGKRDWELALAPVEPHGYTEPTSWADKLARILDLVEHAVGPLREAGSEG